MVSAAHWARREISRRTLNLSLLMLAVCWRLRTLAGHALSIVPPQCWPLGLGFDRSRSPFASWVVDQRSCLPSLPASLLCGKGNLAWRPSWMSRRERAEQPSQSWYACWRQHVRTAETPRRVEDGTSVWLDVQLESSSLNATTLAALARLYTAMNETEKAALCLLGMERKHRRELSKMRYPIQRQHNWSLASAQRRLLRFQPRPLAKKTGDMAVERLRRQIVSGAPPSPVDYQLIVDQYVKVGDIRRAAQWLKRALDVGMMPGKATRESVIKWCFRRGMVEDAADLTTRLNRLGHNVDTATYSIELASYCMRTLNFEAEHRFADMLNSSFRPSRTSSVFAFHELLRRGETAEAARTLLSMQEAGMSLGSNFSQAELLDRVRQGNVSAAVQWLEGLIAGGLEASLVLCNSLIQSCAEARSVVQAVGWLHRMRSLRVAPDVVSYNSVINAHASTGHATKAVQWLSHMLSAGIEPNYLSYRIIVRCVAHRGDPHHADRLLKAMVASRITPDRTIFNSVIRSYAATSQAEPAIACLERMRQSPLSLPDVVSYDAVISAYSRNSDVSRSVQLLEEMDIVGLTPTIDTHSLVMDAHSRRGDVGGAVEWLRKMSSRSLAPNVASYNSVVRACAEKQDPRRAELWLHKLVEARLKPDETSFRTVADSFQASGDHARANRWFQALQSLTKSAL